MAAGRSMADGADEANEAEEMAISSGPGAVDLPPLQQATGRCGPGTPPARTVASITAGDKFGMEAGAVFEDGVGRVNGSSAASTGRLVPHRQRVNERGFSG